MKSLLKRYMHNILVALDQLLSAVSFGDPDETISSRCAKSCRDGNKSGQIAVAVIDFFFGKGHCASSLERFEGKNRIARY